MTPLDLLLHASVDTITSNLNDREITVPLTMTPREQLIQEILLTPDSEINLLLQLIRPLRAGQTHLTQQLQNLLSTAETTTSNSTSSAFDLSRDLAGSLNGPTDLSTNPNHFKGFGE